MDVVITEWALQSYTDLYGRHVFTKADYGTTLRPDVELLQDGFPSPHPQFQDSQFWGPATDRSGVVVQHGFKMKWHNLGPGRVQLRLCVVTLHGKAYLCQAYVKSDPARDKREAAKLKTHINDIHAGTVIVRGVLP